MLLASIHTSVDHAFTVFFDWVPKLVGALVILLIGYLIAKIVGKLVARLTHRGGLDRALHGGPGGNIVQRAVPKPSRLLGSAVFWLLFLGTLSLAASALGIAALTAFIAAVFAYLPNVIAALLIFLIAGAVAAAVATLATRTMGDTGLGKIVATAAPILIMTIATFMILDQLKIAHDIVVITYTALIGAIALGSALAFGLGGRNVAERMLEGAHNTVQENKEQWKADLDKGVSRTKDQTANLKAKASGSETTQPHSNMTDTPATPPKR